MKTKLLALLAATALASAAHGASYTSPVSLLGGPAITFEGFAQGTLIGAGVFPGVTFSQPDSGRPQIDTSPFLFGYVASSGTGVLTGSTEGGAQFPTIAGLIATFLSPVSAVEAFISDQGPLGSNSVSIFGVNGLLETVQLPAETFSLQNPGVYVGFTRNTADIVAVQFGPAAVFGDAFAIDDLRFASGATGVPDAATSATLFSLALLGLAAIRRARR